MGIRIKPHIKLHLDITLHRFVLELDKGDDPNDLFKFAIKQLNSEFKTIIKCIDKSRFAIMKLNDNDDIAYYRYKNLMKVLDDNCAEVRCENEHIIADIINKLFPEVIAEI